MEEKKEARTFIIDYKCPKCEDGYLRPTGLCFTSNPPQFPHKCNTCEYGETIMEKRYPYTTTESI